MGRFRLPLHGLTGGEQDVVETGRLRRYLHRHAGAHLFGVGPLDGNGHGKGPAHGLPYRRAGHRRRHRLGQWPQRVPIEIDHAIRQIEQFLARQCHLQVSSQVLKLGEQLHLQHAAQVGHAGGAARAALEADDALHGGDMVA